MVASVGDARHQELAVFLEPSVAAVVVGADPQHQPIEAVGVVHLQKMADLMRDDRIGDLRRSEHQQAVEVEVLFGGTAPPAGLLTADGDPSVVNAEKIGIVSRAFGQDELCLPIKRVQLLVTELFDLIELLLLREGSLELFFDPALMLLYKGVDVALGQPVRRADDDRIAAYLDRDGLAFGSDQGIVHHIAGRGSVVELFFADSVAVVIVCQKALDPGRVYYAEIVS